MMLGARSQTRKTQAVTSQLYKTLQNTTQKQWIRGCLGDGACGREDGGGMVKLSEVMDMLTLDGDNSFTGMYVCQSISNYML